ALALAAASGRVVAVEREDGERPPCDVAIVTACASSAVLLAAVGMRLHLETRPLQLLLPEPAPPALTPVLGGFERKLSLKQLVDGAYLIGGGWPGRIVDHATNRWEVLEDSVKGSLEAASSVYPVLSDCALAEGWAGLEAFT